MFTKKPLRNIVFIMGILFTLWWSQHSSAQSITISTPAMTNSDPVIGQPFTISWDTIDEALPAVAYNPVDREYLVVWQNMRPSADDDIYAQRISEQGKILSWFFVAKGEKPSLAYNPKNNTYLVVYQKYVSSDYDIYGQRVDFTGPLGPEFGIATYLNDTEHSPAVAYNTHPNHDEFLVVWENIPPPASIINKVRGQRVAGTAGGGDGGFEKIGGTLAIADDNNYHYEPDLAYNLNMNEYMVVFTRRLGSGGSYDVYSRRVTWNGNFPQTQPAPIDSSGNDQYNPAVAAYRLNTATPYLVVFSDTWKDPASDVRGYLVDQDGLPVQLINIAETKGQREYNPAIAQGENWGGYFVTWTQGPFGDHDIFGRQVSDTGLRNSAFDVSGTASTSIVCNRQTSHIAVGTMAALAVWADPCGAVGGLDIVGRMLGYWLYLPLAVR